MHSFYPADTDDPTDADRLRQLLRAAAKAGHMLRVAHRGYLLHTAAGPLFHLIDLDQVADTLGRLRRAGGKAATKKEAHPAQPTRSTGQLFAQRKQALA